MAEYSKLKDIQEYLCEASDFLAQYSWIYDEKDTDIFLCHVLEKIPSEWRESLLGLTLDEVRRVPFNFFKDDWPPSLQAFVQRANKLAEFRHGQKLHIDSIEEIKVPNFIKKNTPAKKLNEIKWMAAAIKNLLLKYHCTTLLDVGSGLGYLDQILHHNFGITIIGFESIEERSHNATHRLWQGNCSKNTHFVNSKVENTDDCLQFIKNKLSEASNKVPCNCGVLNKSNETTKNVMMLGLHSCGNLMQDMMKLFLKLQEVKLFLCVGCCYHLVPLSDFPMSRTATDALAITQRKYPHWSPCTTGLRLACQTTRAQWEITTEEQHDEREKCLFYRAALQHFLKKENLVWNKPKRHLRKRRDISSFENFALYAFQNFGWSYHEKEENSKRLLDLCTEKEHLFPYIKVLHLLQTLLQPIWEGLILADRLSYFLENSVSSELSIMCEELVSPRNVMLFGIKQ